MDLENQLRDQKRQVVQNLTDNIYVLKNGRHVKQAISTTAENGQQMQQVLLKRERKVRLFEHLYKKAMEHRNELMTWLTHSKVFTTERVVKECEEIVKLVQTKNLMNEYYGKKHVKVGQIEEKVGYKMRVTRDPIDDTNYFERKLQTEVDEGEVLISILENELGTFVALSDMTNEFLRHI